MTTDFSASPAMPEQPKPAGANQHPTDPNLIAPDTAASAEPPRLGTDPEITPPAYLDFDPSELVELGSDIESMERLQSQGIERAMIKWPSMKALDIRDFAFDDGGVAVTKGCFIFTLDRAAVNRAVTNACQAVGLLMTGRSDQFYGARLCLTAFHVLLTVANREVFFRTTLYPKPQVEGLAEGQNIALEINLRQLKRLARTQTKPNDTLTFTYDAPKGWLIVRSDRGRVLTPIRLRLETRSVSDGRQKFQDWFGSPVYLHEIDPHLVLQAVRFSCLFAEYDPTRFKKPQVEIRDGAARSINPDRVGEFASDRFGQLHLRVAHQQSDLLVHLLGQFYCPGTHVFDTPDHHVIVDEVMCLAFRKAADWPTPLGPKFIAACPSRIIVVRSVLRDQLEHLAVVPSCDSGRRTDYVTLRVEGVGGDALLTMQASDVGGRSRGFVLTRCTRYNASEGALSRLPTQLGIISRQTLYDVIAHFDSPNVIIEELPGFALRIREDEPDYCATAWISISPPPKDPPEKRTRIGIAEFRQRPVRKP